MTRPASPSRAYREAAGYTLRQMSRLLGIAESTLASYERGGWSSYFRASVAAAIYGRRGVVCDLIKFLDPAPGRVRRTGKSAKTAEMKTKAGKR